MENVPGFVKGTLCSSDWSMLKQHVEAYDRARDTMHTTRIYIRNNTKNCQIELLHHYCAWGFFFSKPEYAFEKEGFLKPGYSGGMIASKIRDLPEGTEGVIKVKVWTNEGVIQAWLYFDTPYYSQVSKAGLFLTSDTVLIAGDGVSAKDQLIEDVEKIEIKDHSQAENRGADETIEMVLKELRVKCSFTGEKRNQIVFTFEDRT